MNDGGDILLGSNISRHFFILKIAHGGRRGFKGDNKHVGADPLDHLQHMPLIRLMKKEEMFPDF